MALLPQQVVEIMAEFYDLGRVEDVCEIFGGYVNRSYRLVVQSAGIRKSYFLRQYKPGIAEGQIIFEHALINHCIARRFSLAARVIANRQGATYIKPAIGEGFIAVFEFLDGEDKYAWHNPALKEEEFISAARVLADFHAAGSGFDSGALRRGGPPIRELLPALQSEFKRYAQSASDRNFHRFYLRHLNHILVSIENSRIMETETFNLPLCPIHCDYHPGNLKYKHNRVVGVFDFDWSKIDLRLFDVCMAVDYFCCSWDQRNDGDLHLEKTALFLNTYQDQLHQTGGMKPLTADEINHLPSMLTAASVCIIHWIVSTFYGDDDLNDEAYLAYLKHGVRLMYSIDRQRSDIVQMAAELLAEKGRV